MIERNIAVPVRARGSSSENTLPLARLVPMTLESNGRRTRMVPLFRVSTMTPFWSMSKPS